MREIKDDPELAKKTLKFTNERLDNFNAQRNPQKSIFIDQGNINGLIRTV